MGKARSAKRTRGRSRDDSCREREKSPTIFFLSNTVWEFHKKLTRKLFLFVLGAPPPMGKARSAKRTRGRSRDYSCREKRKITDDFFFWSNTVEISQKNNPQAFFVCRAPPPMGKSPLPPQIPRY
jgi:hypothetical protein